MNPGLMRMEHVQACPRELDLENATLALALHDRVGVISSGRLCRWAGSGRTAWGEPINLVDPGEVREADAND
jgi:hypothetical protein